MDQMILIAVLTALVGIVVAYFLFGNKKSSAAAGVYVSQNEDEGVDEFMPPPDDSQLNKIPKLSVRAGPRDGEEWVNRVKQEMNALLKYVAMNKATDSEWYTSISLRFRVSAQLLRTLFNHTA